jgi:hypothetical protein
LAPKPRNISASASPVQRSHLVQVKRNWCS